LGNCLYDKFYLAEVSKYTPKIPPIDPADFYESHTWSAKPEIVDTKDVRHRDVGEKGTFDDLGMAELERMGFFDSGDLEEFSNSNTKPLEGAPIIKATNHTGVVIPSKRRNTHQEEGTCMEDHLSFLDQRSIISKQTDPTDDDSKVVGFFSAKSAGILQSNEVVPDGSLPPRYNPKVGCTAKSGLTDYSKSAPVLRNSVQSKTKRVKN